MNVTKGLHVLVFIALFDLHAQFPVLTPFAQSLGATPSFIGLLMGVYSLTHLPGNLLAANWIDRFGSRPFISASLLTGGALLLLQAHVMEPWQLLVIRACSGFVLAFLSPACLSLLAKIATSQLHQRELMTGNGIVHTLASVISPTVGAAVVAQMGFTLFFELMGVILLFTGVSTLIFLKEEIDRSAKHKPALHRSSTWRRIPLRLFLIPISLSCAQGILSFELPLAKTTTTIVHSGYLFSLISIGALLALSVRMLNRVPPLTRITSATLALALLYYSLAVHVPISLVVLLILIGAAKGMMFPAITSMFVERSESTTYGKIFSALSIAYSIGAFIGPLLAGHVREMISPYFIASLVLMSSLCFIPNLFIKQRIHNSL